MSSPEVIYEDEDFVAVNKPAGMLVHADGSKAGAQGSKLNHPTLVDWLMRHYPEIQGVGDDLKVRPGIVHRLDKDTSGVMLVARNQKYFEYLKRLFKNHAIKKVYLALVWGVPKERRGLIDKPIGIKPGTIKRSVFSKKFQKTATTRYEIIKSFEGRAALVKALPETGRTHQIRVHLASIGCPVINDPLYNKKRDGIIGEGRLMLHSASIEFEKEPGKRIVLEVNLPEDFSIAMEDLLDDVK